MSELKQQLAQHKSPPPPPPSPSPSPSALAEIEEMKKKQAADEEERQRLAAANVSLRQRVEQLEAQVYNPQTAHSYLVVLIVRATKCNYELYLFR